MYIIIAGCGKIGSNLAKRLSSGGHDVVVIDADSKSFSLLGSASNCMSVTGMPIDEDVLKEAGIDRADALVSVTGDDNVNIMAAQMARQLYHVPVVITRCYDPAREEAVRTLGLTTVCPSLLAVNKICGQLSPEEDKL
jgi:trk system potassium uptake protein TrkA